MSNCNTIRDLWPLYIDGELSEESRRMVEEHLKECSKCRNLRDERLNFQFGEILQDPEIKWVLPHQFVPRVKRRIGLTALCIFLAILLFLICSSWIRIWYQYNYARYAYEDGRYISQKEYDSIAEIKRESISSQLNGVRKISPSTNTLLKMYKDKITAIEDNNSLVRVSNYYGMSLPFAPIYVGETIFKIKPTSILFNFTSNNSKQKINQKIKIKGVEFIINSIEYRENRLRIIYRQLTPIKTAGACMLKFAFYDRLGNYWHQYLGTSIPETSKGEFPEGIHLENPREYISPKMVSPSKTWAINVDYLIVVLPE